MGVIGRLSGLVKDYAIGFLEGCLVMAETKEVVVEKCEDGWGDTVDLFPDRVGNGIRAGGGRGRASSEHS